MIRNVLTTKSKPLTRDERIAAKENFLAVWTEHVDTLKRLALTLPFAEHNKLHTAISNIKALVQIAADTQYADS